MVNISVRLNHILSTMMMAAGCDLDMSVSQTEDVDWIYLASDSTLWLGILNTVKNILVFLTAGNLLSI
jgi:hypothetical protein